MLELRVRRPRHRGWRRPGGCGHALCWIGRLGDAVARPPRQAQARPRLAHPSPRCLEGYRMTAPMNASAARIPCTVVTGFLGAGKTTLIRHLIENAGGKRLAIIVNE